MNKYIPKVGEEFEWQTLGGWKKENKVVFENEKQIVVINRKGFMDVISKDIDFRQIQTKSDVEREQLLSLMQQSGFFADRVSAIQQAGFTIPPSIKRSDVRRIVDINSNMKGYEDEGLVTAICDLLGDLVEQDEGGAE
jgi:hypothetical protein